MSQNKISLSPAGDYFYRNGVIMTDENIQEIFGCLDVLRREDDTVFGYVIFNGDVFIKADNEREAIIDLIRYYDHIEDSLYTDITNMTVVEEFSKVDIDGFLEYEKDIDNYFDTQIKFS